MSSHPIDVLRITSKLQRYWMSRPGEDLFPLLTNIMPNGSGLNLVHGNDDVLEAHLDAALDRLSRKSQLVSSRMRRSDL